MADMFYCPFIDEVHSTCIFCISLSTFVYEYFRDGAYAGKIEFFHLRLSLFYRRYLMLYPPFSTDQFVLGIHTLYFRNSKRELGFRTLY